MAKQKESFSLSKKTPVQGKETKFIDQRIATDPMNIEFKQKVVIQDGQMLVPYEVVEQLFVENELLRQTLYANQNSSSSRATYNFITLTGNSTSDVIKMAERISNFTKGAIPAKQVYSLVYDILIRNYLLDFNGRLEKESKLQFLWRNGWLPLVCVVMSCVETTLRYYARTGKEFDDLCNALNKKITQPLKPNKKQSAGFTF